MIREKIVFVLSLFKMMAMWYKILPFPQIHTISMIFILNKDTVILLIHPGYVSF